MKSYHVEVEIAEQPEMLRREKESWAEQAAECREHFADLRQLVVLGRGSSGNACTFAAYLWGMKTGRQPIEFRPWLSVLDCSVESDWSDCLAWAFSVSGQSTDIANAAGWLRKRGARVLGITNASQEIGETHIGRVSDFLFRLRAGPENAVPATKTFCAQLFAGAALCGYDIIAPAEDTAECFDEILDSDRASALADFLSGARQVAWLARGPAMASALDAALKLQETAGIPSTGYSSAEFLHGPVGAYGAQDRAVIFLDGDAPFDNHDTVTAALLNKKTPILVIAKQKGGDVLHGSSLPVPYPSETWARGTVLALLAQQASLQLALRSGLNPDAPSGLKKVTQT